MGMLVAPEIHHHRAPRKCAGKVRYRSAEGAAEALVRLTERVVVGRAPNRLDPEHPLSVYSCDHCGSWHFGHRPSVGAL